MFDSVHDLSSPLKARELWLRQYDTFNRLLMTGWFIIPWKVLLKISPKILLQYQWLESVSFGLIPFVWVAPFQTQPSLTSHRCSWKLWSRFKTPLIYKRNRTSILRRHIFNDILPLERCLLVLWQCLYCHYCLWGRALLWRGENSKFSVFSLEILLWKKTNIFWK